MDVAHRRERPPHHLVLKHPRPVQTRDARGQPLADPEMFGFPGDLITETHQTGHGPGDRAFVGAGCRSDMSADVPREVEAPFRRSGDDRLDSNAWHRALGYSFSSSSFPATPFSSPSHL